MTEQALKLFSEHPELVKEIALSYELFRHSDRTKEVPYWSPYHNWAEFIQSNTDNSKQHD